ncbi:MAG: CPBP family intramembrane metalloprotease [Spirochaetales bacterium]|nr:CPBP family intramembrane metalloprotease [Spirochaetales bacterium]
MAGQIIEFFIMFISFFLPNLIVPPLDSASGFLNSFVPLTLYIILSAGQTAFMIFIIKRKGDRAFDDFGLKRFRLSDTLYAILFAAGLFVIYYLLLLLTDFLPEHLVQMIQEGHRWRLENPAMIPLLVIFCLITGYREELLFRSYLLTRCRQAGFPLPLALATGTLLFGLLHMYEGFFGAAFAFTSGFFLSYIFVKKRNIHTISMAHALFNMTALLLSLFEP